MQRLVQAGIVTRPPKWMAVVEAFPPLPKPAVTGTKTKKIVYKRDHRENELVCAVYITYRVHANNNL